MTIKERSQLLQAEIDKLLEERKLLQRECAHPEFFDGPLDFSNFVGQAVQICDHCGWVKPIHAD